MKLVPFCYYCNNPFYEDEMEYIGTDHTGKRRYSCNPCYKDRKEEEKKK